MRTVVAYIRPDKNFEAVHEQLRIVNLYASQKNLVIDREFIDQQSQNKRIDERTDVTDFFQNLSHCTLLIYDSWILTTNMEDFVQMLSCLFKHDYEIHLIKHSVVINKKSDVMLVLGLMDQLRNAIQSKEKKAIGRPKGSRSSSKFDKHHNAIIALLKEKKSISHIARVLEVSRSSLKDYILSRELKDIASGSLVYSEESGAKEKIIDTITCPTPDRKGV
jgi:DNA invertase Pin-like site-specific DNA recombinase